MTELLIFFACALCIVGGYALGYEKATAENITMQRRLLSALYEMSKILEKIEKETKK